MNTLSLIICYFVVIFCCSFCFADKGYEYYCYGNCTDVSTNTQPGFLLIGGGTDVDEGFKWMVNKCNGGNFVVIRASGTDAYNKYIYDLGKLQSVSTFVITSVEGSNDDFVYDTIRKSEGLFIAGGDQYKYINLWNNTKVESAINQLVKRGVPIGGTSAGLHVLGGYLFTAATGGVTSRDALDDPYSPDVTLGSNFLHVSPYLENIIFDTHFYQRDRMGRSLVFLARLIKDNDDKLDFRGISVDEATALLVDSDSNVKVINQIGDIDPDHAAYFFKPNKIPRICERDEPLTFYDIEVHRLNYGATFNLLKWEMINYNNNNNNNNNNNVKYHIDIDRAYLSSDQHNGDIY